MESIIYVQPSTDLTIEEKIALNNVWLVAKLQKESETFSEK